MYFCLCKALTGKEVIKWIKDNHQLSQKELVKRFNRPGDCTTCKEILINEHKRIKKKEEDRKNRSI